MWTTSWSGETAPYTVRLFRNDTQVAAISLDEWWIMSATQHLADTVIKKNDLNFKASELYGPSRIESPLWTTELVPAGDDYNVHLLRGGEPVVVISLGEWASLSTTEYVVEDALRTAEHFSEYGDNIEEAEEAMRQEMEGEDEDDLDEPESDPPRKPTVQKT